MTKSKYKKNEVCLGEKKRDNLRRSKYCAYLKEETKKNRTLGSIPLRQEKVLAKQNVSATVEVLEIFQGMENGKVVKREIFAVNLWSSSEF